jgi:flagellin FlaB
MLTRILKSLTNLHRGQRGMTGLETAIILIAFVTVASVLAYSVLSAGIFSAERGKATVYQGLESAQATMEVQGSVLGLSPNQSELEQVVFSVGLTIQDEKVDMTSVVINYFDNETHSEAITYSSSISGGSVERGTANMLEFDEQHVITATIPAAATREAYEAFTLQVIPPTGATLTIERTLPGYLEKVMDLQ